MKNTIEWSFSLLTDEEQELFEELSIFQGGCSIQAVESLYSSNVLNLLSSLIKKNMIIRKERNGETRYSMLETLREYALLKLIEKERIELSEKLQANYFLSLAREAEPYLYRACPKV